MDNLRLRLQRLRQFRRQDGTNTTLPFVPEADLYSLLNLDTLKTALASPTCHLEPHQREPVAREVFDGARKIFAILLDLGLEEKIKGCLEKCLKDSNLPILEEKELSELFPESSSRFQNLQWQYLPLKFREYSHKDLGSNHVLPFIDNTRVSSGGFATVFKVAVHPLYQDWEPSTTINGIELVRKEFFQSKSYEAQRRESDLLFLLRSLKNDNIVRLVTSYTQSGFCNLHFPVTDYDLHDMLLNSEQLEWTKKPEQVIDSLCGLANGLHYLHNFYPSAQNREQSERITKHGYHYDIKPGNILVKGTRLILADFGLSRLIDVNEATKTVWKNASPTYGGPEAYDPASLQERHIGRAYDIWSFGCVLSEFTTYALEGAAGVKTFRKEREQETTNGKNNCFHCDGELSPPVISWFCTMEDRHQSSSLSSLFKVSSKYLVGDPNKRPKSKELVQDFEYAFLKGWLQVVLGSVSKMEDRASREKLSTVYLARLNLERNRFRAWGYALGLESFDQYQQPRAHQTSDNYERIRLALETCSHELFEFMKQDNDTAIEERVSTLLKSTNDSILLGLPGSVRITIENTFQLLSVSSEKTLQILVGYAEDSGALDSLDRATAHDQSIFQNREAALLAAARCMSLMLTSDKSLSSEGTVKIIETSLIGNEDQTGPKNRRLKYSSPLSIYWYYEGSEENDKPRVLVEKRSYAGKWTSMTDQKECFGKGEEVFDRVKELAKLFQMQPKPKDMRLLNCLGVFHLPASAKFGFVYEFPQLQHEQDDLEPMSLYDLILCTHGQHPTLNDKLTLALAITSCIHSLHLTGWFHKSICTSNIIFFKQRSQADLTKVNLREPYLAGFEQNQQFTTGAYTTNKNIIWTDRPSTHPSFLNNKDGAVAFHPAFDYYSLGAILLEVALWYSFGIGPSLNRAGEGWRSVLSRRAIDEVPRCMGTAYGEAIMACLDFYDNHHHSEEGENESSSLLLKFQHEVLEKLQRMSLGL